MSKKSVVIIKANGEKVPFLRGILVQSLSEAGLDFEDAYRIAQQVRAALSTAEEVPSHKLKNLVAERLEHSMGLVFCQAYTFLQQDKREVMIVSPSRTAPFSVGLLSNYLEGCAIGREEAHKSARTVQDMLRQRDRSEIDTRELRRTVYATLKKDCSKQAANRYLSRSLFEDSHQPLIILIGGPPGSGKSTVAARLSYLLDITHTQSTDIMREIIRCYLAPHVVPTLGYSSYEAWRGLPEVDLQNRGESTDNLILAGFLAQAGTVREALQATIDRSLKEHKDIIIDGVHVLPHLMDLKQAGKKAVVVSVVLAVTTLKRLGRQLRRRSREQPNRDSTGHQRNLEAIWNLQSFMLDQAERSDTRVIVNWSPDETVHLILEAVMDSIAERFPPEPAALDD